MSGMFGSVCCEAQQHRRAAFPFPMFGGGFGSHIPVLVLLKHDGSVCEASLLEAQDGSAPAFTRIVGASQEPQQLEITVAGA